MTLSRAQLRRDRSIENGSNFEVRPDDSCLVSTNESGKTAVLQALLGRPARHQRRKIWKMVRTR
jgi:hypothetical protein